MESLRFESSFIYFPSHWLPEIAAQVESSQSLPSISLYALNKFKIMYEYQILFPPFIFSSKYPSDSMFRFIAMFTEGEIADWGAAFSYKFRSLYYSVQKI